MPESVSRKAVIRIKRPIADVPVVEPRQDKSRPRKKKVKREKKPSKSELLALEGLRFVSFVIGIDDMNRFIEKCAASGKTANERFLELMKIELEGN